jgi:8-oxo-dGTP diphosphatase
MHCYYANHYGEPQPSREIAEVAWLDFDDTERTAPAVQEVVRLLVTAP